MQEAEDFLQCYSSAIWPIIQSYITSEKNIPGYVLLCLYWLTLDRWVWSLFLASVVSWILWLRATLTEFHSCHISLAQEFSTLSISFLICLEAARSLWDLWMLSLLNLAQLSGTDTLLYTDNHRTSLITKVCKNDPKKSAGQRQRKHNRNWKRYNVHR